MSKMLRIDESLLKKLDDLSKDYGKSKKYILEKSLEIFEREQFLKKTNEEYELLIKNEQFIKEMNEDLEAWDSTLNDGLEDYD